MLMYIVTNDDNIKTNDVTKANMYVRTLQINITLFTCQHVYKINILSLSCES